MTPVLRSRAFACSLRSRIVCRRSIADQALDRHVQSYISSSRDPYLNLSIEHHLLQSASQGSAVLFIYVNRPSIIIGRNQNPWLETNLALLQPAGLNTSSALRTVDLVRRRSGGGTVFHDEGNVNWTVIIPSANFTRDKHAEMVVRALRSIGVERARVNERHDVVVDQGPKQDFPSLDPNDTHKTAYESLAARPLKVSGSAYKLTRNRALHHGTCLLSSPNLNVIPRYLHSPAKPHITARGVESVSSPVGNILQSNESFIAAVQKQFANLYSPDSHLAVQTLNADLIDHKNIRKGFEELKSLEWTYLQTPQFSISSKSALRLEPSFTMHVRYGAITEVSADDTEISSGFVAAASDELVGRRLHEISSWKAALPRTLKHMDKDSQGRLLEWLQGMLPPATSSAQQVSGA